MFQHSLVVDVTLKEKDSGDNGKAVSVRLPLDQGDIKPTLERFKNWQIVSSKEVAVAEVNDWHYGVEANFFDDDFLVDCVSLNIANEVVTQLNEVITRDFIGKHTLINELGMTSIDAAFDDKFHHIYTDLPDFINSLLTKYKSYKNNLSETDQKGLTGFYNTDYLANMIADRGEAFPGEFGTLIPKESFKKVFGKYLEQLGY